MLRPDTQLWSNKERTNKRRHSREYVFRKLVKNEKMLNRREETAEVRCRLEITVFIWHRRRI